MINKMFVASLDVDAQCGFSPLCPNELPVPGGDSIVAELNAQAKYAYWRVGSKDAHPANPVWLATKDHSMLSKVGGYPNSDLYWPSHCVVGTPGFELLPSLPKPEEYNYFVWKGMEPHLHPYGACFHDINEKMSTGLIEFLRSKNISTVIVGGLATDYCVFTTCKQLIKAHFNVILNEAACRGVAEKTTVVALNDLKERHWPQYNYVFNAEGLAKLIEL